ncbi:MAG: HlyD family efflux transporter periplasmic adaptor subunit [Patescibacteria group bacterium]
MDKRELQLNLKKYLLDFSKERHDFDEDLKVTYQDKALTDTINRILAKNQSDLDKTVLDVEIKDLAIKLATLISPIDGIVTHIDVPVPGVNVLSTTANFTVADPENLVFEAEIDETDIGKLKLGQTGRLILDAFPNTPFNLTVDSIDFNSSTDAAGSTIYLVKFNLTNDTDLSYRLGMNGEVIITTNQKEAVLTVPIEAVSNNQIQLVEANQITQQTVVTGIESDTEVEIISGLTADQLVVIGNKSK